MENEPEKTESSGWIKKSIEIDASDDAVWNTLTNPEYTSQWASAFEAGSSVASDWNEGSLVIWKGGNGGPGVKGKVEVNYAPKMLKIGFYNSADAGPDDELSEYKEHYLLSEHEGKTMLTIESGPLTPEYVEKYSPMWDAALKIMKEISEQQ
ncbi:SRPBCC family protein [Pedobacter metabolipauper]|uniref:Activator of Hsp90 ATPase-like protein n=1 Tax=Pedobacter metabolipauper TaxID=425513 RepID=A0A4V3D1Q4_9SPHI|nr:SRPBCC domain-containing protein [Pedobacter metabolipauper]TDQ12083.1 activator of Hsp90 ATPase-like protein [Pedobacter metabolipauper]